MELKMKNWNKILNNFIAGFTIIIVAMIIGLGFISPKSYAIALTKADIQDYNIYFVSALTKSRSATGISRVQLTGMDEDKNLYDYYTYQYDYTDFSDTELFYGSQTAVVEDEDYGNVSISSQNSTTSTNETIFTSIGTNLKNAINQDNLGFIPNNVNYFTNVDNTKQEIFYNEIDDGDYVLIDNYTSHTNNSNFNVENFYLSFGTPYIDDNDSTPLYDLRVEGKLYSEGITHYLAINNTSRIQIETKQYVEFWNQYFDLRTLTAYQVNEPNSDTYTIENQQGKYEFTFYFTRYDENFDPIVNSNSQDSDNPYLTETFTYTFYLLDSAEYSSYPTIYEAEIEVDTLSDGATNEYYYSFNTDTPYVNYDPTKYNLSYTRANNKSVNNVTETITSTFKEGAYNIDGFNYEKGIITYYNTSSILKQVFILTYYNEDKTLVEHLYLSRENVTSTDNFNPTTYEVFVDNLESGNLQFEYKSTKVLENSNNAYYVKTYKTTTYENFGFITEDFTSITLKDGSYSVKDSTNKTLSTLDTLTNTEIVTVNSNVIRKDTVPSDKPFVTFGSYPQVTKSVEDLAADDGILINTNTLADDTSGTLNSTNSKYKLTATGDEYTTKTYTLTKYYVEVDVNKEISFSLQVTDVPLNEVISLKDSVNPHITIEYVVVEKTTEGDTPTIYRAIEEIKFAIRTKTSITNFSSYSNLTELFDVIDYENYTLGTSYTYDYKMCELGIYDIKYAYVVNASDNTYFTNTKLETTTDGTAVTPSYLNPSNSSNYTAPINFSASHTTNETVVDDEGIESNLYFVVSGKVVDTKVTLNGETFVYVAKTNTLTNEDSTTTYTLDSEYTYYVNNDDGVRNNINRTFSIKSVNGDNYLYISYYIGTVNKKTDITTTKYILNGKEGYRSIDKLVTTTNYSLKSYGSYECSEIFPTTGEWNSVITAIRKLEDNSTQTSVEYSTKQATQGQDKLHIFGSISYFNKADNTTDSNYAKLQQIDSKLGVNYISDVTQLYNEVNKKQENYLSADDATASSFAGNIATLLTKDEIIITDVTPVLWNNFSTLYYTNNNKNSKSYVFRYTNYSFNSDGTINCGSAVVTSTYTKDIKCQFDGLYEVVVFYQYENLPTTQSSYIYYQLFTFIIDNSSPSIILETENEREIADTEELASSTTLSLTLNGQTLSNQGNNFAYYSDSKTIVTWLNTNYSSSIKTGSITNLTSNISTEYFDSVGNTLDTTNTITVQVVDNYYGPSYEIIFDDTNSDYNNLIIYFANSLDYAGYDYKTLDENSYTNKNVRISWEIPTYFQNDIYIEIDKQYYNTTNTTANAYNFNAIYKALEISTEEYIETYVKAISEMSSYTRLNDEGVIKNFYYVDLKVEDESTGYNINGNYNIVVHYSSSGKSTFTVPFVIDKIDIAGLTIESVLKNADGTFQVDPSIDLGNTQIVNSDFTFRFDRKESSADIFVYYDEIELTNSSDYDKIVTTADGDFGITTKYLVSGEERNISVGTPYTYEYTHEYSQNYIAKTNIISSNSSKLFLFRLEDEAGNQARYVVFYDGTEPRFLTVPKPDSETHIVNDTTRVIWGDYKAIKVSTDEGFEITNTNNVTNYTKENDSKLSLVLRYISSTNNKYAFNDLKVEKIGEDYYILVPITTIKIEDSEYGNKFELDLTSNTSETKDYYFFPTLPFIIKEYVKDSNGNYTPAYSESDNIVLELSEYKNDGSIIYQAYEQDANGNLQPIYDYSAIEIPTYNSDGSVIYDTDGEIKKVRFEVISYSEQTIKNYNNEDVIRYVTVTYYVDKNNNITNTITGAVGEGKYIYSVRDGLGNKTSGLIWMNLDKTQTMAYGIFDYSDKLANATAIEGTTETLSASKMFITSLVPTDENQIPNYDVTYKHYAYDTSIYTDYTISSVSLVKDDTSLATYINIELSKSGTKKTVQIQLTDEDGNEYPRYSYPYSLEGNAIVSDTQGNPKDVYSAGYQFRTGDDERKFSLALNTTTDTEKEKIVTEEGLYIFKRTYTDKNIDKATLGTDKRIIYRVYYVDRSGIINISAGESVASTLYNVGKDIEFTLGSNYSDDSYKKEITASSIQNNQKADSTSKTSNSSYMSSNLFDTNKIQVQFRLTYDKYNFYSSIGDYMTSLIGFIDNKQNTSLSDAEKETIKSYLSNTIFNQRYFEDNYEIELQLSVGASVIIDETDDYFSTTGLQEFLKNTGYLLVNNQNNVQEKVRTNYFDFYLDTASNSYQIVINDQAGYALYNEDGSLINANYLPNDLGITFDISHTAPDGEFYGKYYGRHNYDENKSDTDTPLNVPSIPYEDGKYALLNYLEEGQLDLLSENSKSSSSSLDGSYVKLYSTNNETMIFTFAITNDAYKAQIDPNNIKVYKGSIATENLIFNRVNGSNISTSLVPRDRQSKAFITDTIGDTTYYAIIIFDNNLDDIVDVGKEDDYLQYRLLDSDSNPDKETYYVQINYVGNSDDYIGQDNNANKVSFYKTTFEIDVDRIKPLYNLTKLMSLDEYVYNTSKTTTNIASNYEKIFESYKSAYNFSIDTEQDFERSDIENYFFALDTRENTSFVFEQISELDNNNALYIRKVDKNSYKFSVTPDDYKAYYNATYLQGHPQFTPSTATTVTTNSLNNALELDKYYKIQFALDTSTTNGLSANFLKQNKVFEENCYYEIIEEDEAGNYRVYAVYIPQESSNKISYTYQTNSNSSSLQKVSIAYGDTPYVQSNGMELNFATIQTKDNFLKTTLNIVAATNKSGTIDHKIEVVLNPNDLTVTALNRTLGTTIYFIDIDSKDKDGYANTDKYVEAINYVINYYYGLINNKEHAYYSEFGYTVYIEVIDRLGIVMKDTLDLYNYEIDYIVAGSTLTPKFTDYATNFTMLLDGQKGSTYLTDITVYKFNKIWSQINSDNSSPRPQIFDKSEEELKKSITYVFNRGIYKFVFTDNFNRTTEYFYEFGISSSQTGGSLSYQGKYSTITDGYTYSSEDITYSYDSSVYNVYIKFIGKIPSEFAEGEYQQITDAQNYVIFNSGVTYTDEYLKTYGLNIITSGNTTTITFSGIKDALTEKGITTLSQYQIKTILASTVTNYTWGAEETNKDIFAYTKKIALYTGIQNATIRNTSGNTLDTSEHLNLTEDFNIVLAWPSNISTSERLSFNSRIILTRTYSEKGTIKTHTSQVESGTLITLPGEYSAYVINDLGMMSKAISFTRGEGEISMYAVYGVNSQLNTESKLSPSSLIATEELDAETKVLFTYFITNEYFSYKDAVTGDIITMENFEQYIGSETLPTDFVSNVNANNYIDVRVNSNLSIKTEVYEIGYIEYSTFTYPYVKYQIYSDTKVGDAYIYRFIQVVFVDKTNTKLADTRVFNSGAADVNLAEYTSVVTSTSESVYIEFDFADQLGFFVPYGDTLYLDRYYNNEFVETIVYEVSSNLTASTFISLNLSQVGIHEFVLRDLAGRTNLFNGGSNKLQIYLINEILYTVNGENPINNQVFNNDVNISIVFLKIGDHQLYNDRTLNITITRNGEATNLPNNNGEFTLSEAGYYNVVMSATTQLLDGTSSQVSSTYNFVIVDTEIATRSFSISKGTNFTIEKLIKSVNGQETDITDTYSVSSTAETNVLLWLAHEEQGNSIFKVTLKYYENVTESYRTFDFSVWINNQSPVIISSIDPGTKTKETITINFNPGLIYTQIGKGYITLDDEKITDINSESVSFVDTITISDKGTHWLKIYSEDGKLIGSYKFTKSEPMNGITKFIIIGVVIAILVVTVLFFLLRRKGRYR